MTLEKAPQKNDVEILNIRDKAIHPLGPLKDPGQAAMDEVEGGGAGDGGRYSGGNDIDIET